MNRRGCVRVVLWLCVISTPMCAVRSLVYGNV